MKNKQIISLILSVVLILFVFSACQNNAQSEAENTPVKDDKTVVSDELSVPDEITMAVVMSTDGHLKAAAKLYEEKTGVKVNIENNYNRFSGNDGGASLYAEQALSSLNVGGGADIYDVRLLDHENLGKNGLLVDMSSWLNSDEEFSDEVMFRDILLSGKTQDNVFAIPVDFYFLRMFASSEDESFPENKRMTWTEFFEQVRENGYLGDVAYLYTDLEIFMERFTSRASEFIDETGNTQALNSPEMIAMLEECMAWKEAGLCSDSGDPAHSERSYSYIGFPINRFRVADALCTLPDFLGKGSYYGYYVSPIPYDGEPVIIDGTEHYPVYCEEISSYGVNAGSPNVEAAQDFLKFLLSQEAQEVMISVNALENGFFYLPVNRGAFRSLIEKDLEERFSHDPGIEIDVPSLVDEAEKAIKDVAYILPHKSYYDTIIKKTAEQFFLGNISAEEAVKQMANKVDLYLKEQK